MLTRLVVLSLFLTLAGGCARTYNIQSSAPFEFGVHSMEVPSFLKPRVVYTRINDFVLHELPKSKIDNSGTVGGIAAKKMIGICPDVFKCQVVFEGPPTNASMVREGGLVRGAAFETDLGYIWMRYLSPASMAQAYSDILLTQRNYKPVSAAPAGSYRTRYGAIGQTGEMTYWQTLVQGKNESGSQTVTIYYASEPLDSDKDRINPKLDSLIYILYGPRAEYVRKRTVCGLEGKEWMVEKDLSRTRYYEWFFVGGVPDVGEVRFTIALEGPLSMNEDWHEAIWNFILNSMRPLAAQ